MIGLAFYTYQATQFCFRKLRDSTTSDSDGDSDDSEDNDAFLERLLMLLETSSHEEESSSGESR